MGTVERRGWQARVAGKLVEIVKWFTMRPHRKDPQLDELRQRTQGIYDELRPQLIEIAKSDACRRSRTSRVRRWRTRCCRWRAMSTRRT